MQARLWSCDGRMTKRIVLLQALATTPNDLTRMLQGRDDTAVARRPSPKQWSVADVLCHLDGVEKRSLERLQLVVADEQPQVLAIHPDEITHDLTQPVAQLLSNFAHSRQKTLAYLKDLKPGEWQRTAVHETRGVVKLRYLVQYLVDHDTEHLNQIVEIQQRMGK
jgi:uncharacterized damage-inducible protein DinB